MENISFYLDILFLVVIIFSVIIGVFRGLISEVISLIVWILTFCVFYAYGNWIISKFIATHIDNTVLQSIICFVSILVVFLIIGSIAKYLLRHISSIIGFRFANILGGALFGLFRSVLIITIIIKIIQVTNIDNVHSWQDTKTYQILHPIIDIILIKSNRITENINNNAKINME